MISDIHYLSFLAGALTVLFGLGVVALYEWFSINKDYRDYLNRIRNTK